MRLGALALALALAPVVVAGCGGDDDDETLDPLPIGDATVPVTTTTTAPPAGPSGTAASTAVTTTAPVTPIGDWDGAQFDVGTIQTLSVSGEYRTIGFDRYSFTGPGGVTVDAAGFDEEPLAAWWRTSPFSNVRPQPRTFVLARGVEVLVLDPAGRAAACAGPPPSTPPTPPEAAWEPADIEVLEDPDFVGAIATLTYSATGQVTRIRFTEGC